MAELPPTGSKFHDDDLVTLGISTVNGEGTVVPLYVVPTWMAILDSLDVATAVQTGVFRDWTGESARFLDCMAALALVKTDVGSVESGAVLTEGQEDLLGTELLRFADFDKRTFHYLIKPILKFSFRGKEYTIIPDMVLRQVAGSTRLCFVKESKQTDAASAEPQVVVETLAVAYDNYWNGRGGDQLVYAVRLRGTKLRFYRAEFAEGYLRSLPNHDAPKGNAVFARYPSGAPSAGLDLLVTPERQQALQLLHSLRKQLQPTPPSSPA